MSAFVCLALWFVTWPLLCLWRAYVVVTLWNWFGLPYTNFPAPSLYVVLGLLLVLHTALPFHRQPKNDETSAAKLLSGSVAFSFCTSLTMLSFGWYWKWLQWGLS